MCDLQIWLNVQYEKSVTRTRWDVTQGRDWNPAFGRYQAAPTAAGSVQPNAIDYTPPAIADARLLQDKLETTLRTALMKWRVKSKTVWNRYCIAVLRKILPYLERETWNNAPENNDYLAELQHLLVSHKVRRIRKGNLVRDPIPFRFQTDNGGGDSFDRCVVGERFSYRVRLGGICLGARRVLVPILRLGLDRYGFFSIFPDSFRLRIR